MNAGTVGSLFSGIGGLDLGLERAGWQVAWQAENDPYCSQVLAKHWPDVPNLGDVTKIVWEEVERVDLVCGGFPCQPVSSVGERRGLDDERWLWPEMEHAVRVLRPNFVLVENVAGLLTLGFDDVLGGLAALGYNAEWSIVPACALGAPHSRERVFVVAYAESGGRFGERFVDHTKAAWRARSHDGEPQGSSPPAHWASVPEPELLGMAHGVPTRLDRDRLHALGNAVVPQVAEWIGAQLLSAISCARGSA